MLVLPLFLISRLINRSGLRIFHSKVFSSGDFVLLYQEKVFQLGFPANETFREKMRKSSVAFRKLFRETIFPFRWKPYFQVVQPILVIKHNIKIHSEIRCFLTRIAHICTLVAMEHLKSSHKSSSYELNFKRIGCKNVLMTVKLQIKDIAPRDMQF